MTKVFISHASEDKDAIARSLANELGKDHTVWFDEYVLHVGDSLRQKIDEGLRTCDFGIVVLSPSFFSKKWPRLELDGLFALEDKNRKLILPVWHNVTADDVKAFSPILADRVGVSSIEGATAVATKLRLAMTSSTRTQQINSGHQELRKYFKSKKEDEYDERMKFGEDGVALLYNRTEDLFSLIEQEIRSTTEEFGSSRFVTKRSEPNFNEAKAMKVFGPNSIHAVIALTDMYANSARSARLNLGFFVSESYAEQSRHLEGDLFAPRFCEGGVVNWVKEDGGRVLSSADFVSTFFNSLVRIIEEAEPDR